MFVYVILALNRKINNDRVDTAEVNKKKMRKKKEREKKKVGYNLATHPTSFLILLLCLLLLVPSPISCHKDHASLILLLWTWRGREILSISQFCRCRKCNDTYSF